MFLQNVCEDPTYIDKNLWFDEAVFKLNGHITRHNCVYWSVENPHVAIERRRFSIEWCCGARMVRLKFRRRGSIEWSPRSPDLTPCDFFLWGALRYRRRPRSIEELAKRRNHDGDFSNRCPSFSNNMSSLSD